MTMAGAAMREILLGEDGLETSVYSRLDDLGTSYPPIEPNGGICLEHSLEVYVFVTRHSVV
jgi:hypothetical protein